MAQSEKNYSPEEVKSIVKNWLSKLKVERKCSNTNSVAKIVKNNSNEIQECVRNLIAEEIKIMILASQMTKDINNVQEICNVINGCFDNFTHAVDGVKLSFVEIVTFIDFGIAESLCRLLSKCSTKNFLLLILQVLHSLSRILILVLKLKRNQSNRKNVNSQQISSSEDLEKSYSSENLMSSLSRLTYKIGTLLKIDDVLIDTKTNLAMSAILIREIVTVDEFKLIKFHEDFIKTIPSDLADQNIKHIILKFFFSNAIINTWSVNIIDSNATKIYLKFFINLCEKYSSDTSIVLSTSRTLLLLIKHDSFKEFLNSTCKGKVEEVIVPLLSCIFMLLEHPVACIRHSARDFLQVLASNHSILTVIIDSVFTLPNDKRSYYICVAALASEVGSRNLIQKNKDLPKQLFAALYDPTIVSHVSQALENMILNDSLVEEDFSNWCEIWIVPLLISLMHVLPIVAADIDKILEKAFKKNPNSVIYVIDKWAHPKSEEELRCVITSLKIGHKQGFKLKVCIDPEKKNNEKHFENKIGVADGSEEKWKNLISIKLLEHCMHHADDDIRISSFSLLIEAHKSTEPYSETDFKLIQHFLKYNLNNQQPATRQKILGLVRKMLIRFSESKNALLKVSKNIHQERKRISFYESYEKFLDSLVAFCFSNIFVGCNFNRLNTVLNILLLCFENINNMCFSKEKGNFYWNKFLVALDSSYEENKELAVVLLNKLELSLLDANKPEATKVLYDKAFNLCTHMEPPDVLTGSYLLQALINLPSSLEILSKYFAKDYIFNDINYCCLEILLRKLEKQTALAKLDLMTAATCGPMYGILFAIRLIFRNINFSAIMGETSLKMWGKLLKQIVEVSFEMTHIVGCVVNSSSPEGHLPMDFQTDFEKLGLLNDIEDSKISGFHELRDSSVVRETKIDALKIVYENFIEKYNEIEYILQDSNYDCYETVRTINSLLKENELLVRKLNIFDYEKNTKSVCKMKCLNQLFEIRGKLEHYVGNLDKKKSIINWPATAQVLLLCAWRSIKEASLYLGDLVSKLPVEELVDLGLLTNNIIIKIGDELKILLCEIKHRGAFEHAYIGFSHLVNSLWKCSDKYLSNLPRKWMDEVFYHLESPLKDQKIKLCSTRRSAGLPFMIQAIVCSEIISLKSKTPSSFHCTMNLLLSISENGVESNSESKIHSLNILRALFKHAQLGEHVASYVSRAVMVAIRGSRASSWSERNSSNLLFSSLIIRIFGVARSRDDISKKNRMTSRTFFQRYRELYDFLLSEMQIVYPKENTEDNMYDKPSLYLVLLVLGRLYPSPVEDSENIDLSEFLPYINISRKNPIMKIRELGARALVPLISYDRIVEELDNRFKILSSTTGVTQNERHGILLQIKALLSESMDITENSVKVLDEMKLSWIENTRWILNLNTKNKNQISFIISSCYVKVLHILFKCYSFSREKVCEVVINAPITENFSELNISERKLFPGLSLFLENFYYLKTDILVYQCFNLKNKLSEDKFLNYFKFMLNDKISEVQSVPLRILCFVLQNGTMSLSEDDFNEIGAPIRDLLLFQKKDNVSKFWSEVLSSSEIVNVLVEELNKCNNKLFKSKFVHRLWLTVVSTLVMKKRISVLNSSATESNSLLQINFCKQLLMSDDKDLSTHAFMCYSTYLIEALKLKNTQEAILSDTSDHNSTLFRLMNEFSSPDADIRKRMALANILSNNWKDLTDGVINSDFSDPFLMNIWMIPLRLIADEDSSVRVMVSKIVHKIENSKITNWPDSPAVTLKSQEVLLDAYISIVGTENIIHILIQMFVLALSSLCDFSDTKNYCKDEFGVFEKGNPNPYCEELALSNLVCQKLLNLRTVVDLDALIQNKLNFLESVFVAEIFQFTEPVPGTVIDIVNLITSKIVDISGNSSEQFSLPKLQIKNLRMTLGLPEVL